jgi:hypothetical protein
MVTESDVLEGGCLCGQVRFTARGAPVNVRVCHCRLCQRAMAGPFFVRALYDAGQVTLRGETIAWPSSDALFRLSCARCGGRVGASRPSAGRMALPLAAFDDPGALEPECHFFTASKAPWLTLDDDLPQYEEWPPS